MNILDCSYKELEEYFHEINEPVYRVDQVFQWLYQKYVFNFMEMTNLSKNLRDNLSKMYTIDLPILSKMCSDPGDNTQKLVLQLADGSLVESVILFENEKTTMCLSTQAGCPLGCIFCRTGMLGFKRNLSQGEILGQILLGKQLVHPDRISNVVVMGMGEPFLNYQGLSKALSIVVSEKGMEISPRRITVSTSGIIPCMQKFGLQFPNINLAISLNATTNETREKIMPITKKYPLHKLLAECEKYPLRKRKRLTFEYVMVKSLNDTIDDAYRLAKLLRRIKCKINLIPLNNLDYSSLQPSDPEHIVKFQKILVNAGYTAILRKSKGSTIMAACGQLGINPESGI